MLSGVGLSGGDYKENRMKSPFPTKDLDNLLKACIEYTDHHGPYFYTGNICGRDGVPTDDDSVKRMFDWIAKTDKGLMEDCGFGNDNIHYFRLGHDAIDINRRGGFAKYLRNRSRSEFLDNFRLWAPIGISIAAIVVSVFALKKPADSAIQLESLRGQLIELQSEQEQLREAVEKSSIAQDGRTEER